MGSTHMCCVSIAFEYESFALLMSSVHFRKAVTNMGNIFVDGTLLNKIVITVSDGVTTNTSERNDTLTKTCDNHQVKETIFHTYLLRNIVSNTVDGGG